MANENTNGVVGTDSIVPVYDPNAKWAIWGLHEIWQGTIGANRYVPKVNDYVIDATTYTTYIVDFLDPVSLIPTIREIRPPYLSGVMSETDILFGVGPGTQSDTYRVYIDKFTTPYTMAIDARLRVAGSMTSYAKIFKGSDLGETGELVSMMYDNSGNFVSHNVPLEVVMLDNHTNYFVKVPKVFKTTRDLLDGEVVTAVFYSDNGHVVSKRQLLVENTSFIRSSSVPTKYVTHISLESPFLSATSDRVIEFPLNIPANALNLIGVVNYSDGSRIKLPVDSTKFKMIGLEQYLSSIEGQELGLVLTYSLSDTEEAYAGVTSNGRHITEPYTLKTVNPNLSYSVKLYVYPEWDIVTEQYSLRWFLFNLDRNVRFDVTNKVQFNPNTGAFNPTLFNITQRKSVSVNLNSVSQSFKNFLHTQVVDITLFGTPAISGTKWLVSHDSIPSHTAYGLDLLAQRVSQTTIKIDAGIGSKTQWLDRVYGATYPVIDPVREIYPPEPTHMLIRHGSVTTEVPMPNWNAVIDVGTVIVPFKNVYITFIRRVAATDSYLSEAAMMVLP